MELLEGYTLNHELKLKPKGFEEQESLLIMEQILECLVYLHHNGVMHRDVNPTNIQFIQKNNHMVKLFDFGIAQYIDAKTFFIPQCGTPGYVSPEVAKFKQNHGQMYNEKCDVYAAGCVLFKILTNRNLFQGGNQLNISQISKQCLIDSFKSNGISLGVQVKINFFFNIYQQLLIQMLEFEPEVRISSQQALYLTKQLLSQQKHINFKKSLSDNLPNKEKSSIFWQKKLDDINWKKNSTNIDQFEVEDENVTSANIPCMKVNFKQLCIFQIQQKFQISQTAAQSLNDLPFDQMKYLQRNSADCILNFKLKQLPQDRDEQV